MPRAFFRLPYAILESLLGFSEHGVEIVDSRPDDQYPRRAVILRIEADHLPEGEVSLLYRTIDPKTGAIAHKVVLENILPLG